MPLFVRHATLGILAMPFVACFVPLPDVTPPGMCTAGQSVSCYEGPEGTLGVGVCRSGAGRCADDGSGVEACTGQVVPSPERCDSSSEDEDCDGQPDDHCASWALRVGTLGVDDLRDVAVLDDDSVVITGRFRGPLRVADGPQVNVTDRQESYVARLDPDGTHRWTARLAADSGEGSPGHSFPLGIAAVGSRIYVVGQFRGALRSSNLEITAAERSLYVAGFEATATDELHGADMLLGFGAPTGTTGETNGGATGVAVTPEGDIVVCGWHLGPIEVEGTLMGLEEEQDALVMKIASDGSVVWVTPVETTGVDRVDHVVVDDDGASYVAGQFGGPLELAGCSAEAPLGGTDGFVAKLDANGDCVWLTTIEGEEDQRVVTVAVDETGVVIGADVLGEATLGASPLVPIHGGIDLLLAALSPTTGEVEWWRRDGSPGDERMWSVRLGPTDRAYIGASISDGADCGEGTHEVVDPLTDALLLAIDREGHTVFARHFGGGGDDDGYVAVPEGADHVLFGGQFETFIDLGTGPIEASSADDGFLARIPIGSP